MASWEEGAGFRIVGMVKRVFVNPSGTFAAVTVTVNMHPHQAEHDLKSFDRILNGDIREQIRQGQRVQFTGKIENEKLTRKLEDGSRDEVIVDGRPVWMAALRIKAFDVEGSSRAPAPRAGQTSAGREPGGDDGPPADPMRGGTDPFGGSDPMGGGRNPFGS